MITKSEIRQRESVYFYYKFYLNKKIAGFYIFCIVCGSMLAIIFLWDEFKEYSFFLIFAFVTGLALMLYYFCISLFYIGKLGMQIDTEKEQLSLNNAYFFNKDLSETLRFHFLKRIINSPEYYTLDKKVLLDEIKKFTNTKLREASLYLYFQVTYDGQDNLFMKTPQDERVQTYKKILQNPLSSDREIKGAISSLLEIPNLTKETLILIISKASEENSTLGGGLSKRDQALEMLNAMKTSPIRDGGISS